VFKREEKAMFSPRDFTRSRYAASVALSAVILTGCGGGGATGVDDEGPFFPLPAGGFPRPVRVSDTLSFGAITTSHHHSCGLQPDGRVWCWGSNEYGQLGSSAPMQRCAGNNFACSATPLPLDGDQRFARVAASIRHTCGLDLSGQAWCWGFGEGGQLGDGRRENSPAPVAVSGGLQFLTLAGSVSGNVTCALTPGGEAWCWGPDLDGVLGNGTREGSDVPVPVLTSDAFISISVGQRHACAVTTAGDAYCWGLNWFGNLGVGSAGGDGGLGRSNVPLPVTGGVKFTRIAAGGEHTCALAEDGRAWCWGLGHLTGTTGAVSYVSSPVSVAGNRAYIAISAGFAHSCALTAGGQIDCWGENFDGKLGNGAFGDSETPVRVDSAETFVAVAAGGAHTCAVSAAQAGWCWGGNAWGGVGRPPSDP
jgi:alpha-tubulin suppressor-like RCC1 family protein